MHYCIFFPSHKNHIKHPGRCEVTLLHLLIPASSFCCSFAWSHLQWQIHNILSSDFRFLASPVSHDWYPLGGTGHVCGHDFNWLLSFGGERGISVVVLCRFRNVLGHIWMERNARIFEDKFDDMASLWDRVLWASALTSFRRTPLFSISWDWRTICDI